MPYAPPPPQPPSQPAAQYEVIPEKPAVRRDLWLSDGPAEIDSSSNRWLGNRFQLGGEAQMLPGYRLILGVTMFDILGSGESSPEIGAISRYGFDFRVGYFLITDTLFVEYGLYLGEVRGSDVFGWVGTIGQSLGLGWQFYTHGQLNMAIEAAYQYISSENVGTFDRFTGATGTSTYPGANTYSLNVRVGFNFF